MKILFFCFHEKRSRLLVGRVPISFTLSHVHYFHTIISYTRPKLAARADSEGFRRIETRAKSNSVVLPSKLESFNRRRSVRDRVPPPPPPSLPPLLFRIEYMPFYVAARPRSVDGRPASAISSCILNGSRGFDFLPRFQD